MPAAVHVALVIGTGSCLPSSAFTIEHWGCWIRKDSVASEHQKWIEVYAWVLQQLAEVSMGQSWTTEGQTMTPEVTKLVKTFLAVTGTHVSLHIIRKCWPTDARRNPSAKLGRVVCYHCEAPR